jgi:hypothetical protein
MYKYFLEFDNGHTTGILEENLDKVHNLAVEYINLNDIKTCFITCEGGAVRRVRKTGEYHLKHNGFSFD